MRKYILILILLVCQSSIKSQTLTAEDYYDSAYNEITRMLSGKSPLSIKRAVYLAEWAYYEGKLDYHKDFCDEIERIVKFVNLFYRVNRLSQYKTGKQMALNEYFGSPYSGNNYKPYTYDFTNFSMDNNNWETQFVSKVLKTHLGQCRSLPWMYKILAVEIDADASIAHAPGHCYIMYRDEDNLTSEDWINLELTTLQMQPASYIKHDFEICDSAIIAGTYMTPLTDKQTIACQLSELAFGYIRKFNRYDEFTYYCANKSLEYYPMNPNAVIIVGKSLTKMLMDHVYFNNGIIDDYAISLGELIQCAKRNLYKTYWREETDEFRQRRYQKAIEAEKYTNKYLLPK